ncbi:hypothetical protein MKZ38_002751 [Zalerion maritima]|uniref:beta-galactosidase n=1 Tax=Zalerion maritima TaxID=339359 RepID=A0AAD5RPR9_9PEZI|nr:hypothetical protein MKZ38_002751 [Zalerion maritima]
MDRVEWVPYSFTVDGERHILQKFKASGFTTVSIYLFWSYHSPLPGALDVENGAKNVQRFFFFDHAREAGLYVIARAGPHCNAETNGGGLGSRSTDPTEPVILNKVENELQDPYHDPENTLVRYMPQIETTFRNAGAVVPLTHNEKGMRAQSWLSDYLNVGGAVDICGLDSYPGGFSCANVDGGFNLCESEHSPSFPDVYYKNNIGQRTTLLNVYMAYGGTNWGHSAAGEGYGETGGKVVDEIRGPMNEGGFYGSGTYGKFVPHIGPQTRFPVPPGVLNTRGENWVAVGVWNFDEEHVEIAELIRDLSPSPPGLKTSSFCASHKDIQIAITILSSP